MATSTGRRPQLLVVSLPSGPDHVDYYRRALAAASADFTDVLRFFKGLGDAVREARGGDCLLVLYPRGSTLIQADTFPPGTYLLALDRDKQQDLWMRDFTPVGLHSQPPCRFRYSPGYLSRSESGHCERQLTRLLQWLRVPPGEGEVEGEVTSHSNLALDGGNVVDCARGAVVTRRVEKENRKLTPQQIHEELESRLGHPVCLIPDPGADDTTGHADGLIAFIDTDHLLVADYGVPSDDSADVTSTAISAMWPEMTIIRLPCIHKPPAPGKRKFSSAVGCYINLVVTDTSIYMPIFSTGGSGDAEMTAADARATEIVDDIAKRTGKTLGTVNTGKLSHMGGSVRCMTWQMYADQPIARALLARAICTQ